MPSLDYLKQHGVYFYFPEKRFAPAARHYAAECLASGLRELGVRTSANVAHELFQQRELGAFRDGVIVFSITEDVFEPALIQGIADFKPGHKVILSMADVTNTILTPPRVLSLMTHENRFLTIAGRRQPWAFGLSHSRIQAAQGGKPFAERQRVLLRNFRPSHGQSVRDSMDCVILPQLEPHFQIDWSIATENYFDRLRSCVGCLAYGGQYGTNLLRNNFFATVPEFEPLRQWTRHVTYHREPVILRWDSWRWWESLAAGCLTFHLDFEKYGFALPVMPEPWRHYIPIDASDPKGTAERLLREEPRWAEIAAAGRAWAIEHYSPRPTAQRFVDLLRDYQRN